MKRIFLTIFFATYYFFMPFVMVNCSVEDRPYALTTDASAADISDGFTLEQCENMEFTVEGCLDILQAEEQRLMEEESAVSTASLMINDFEICQAEESMADTLLGLSTEADDAESSDEDSSCECVITDIILAYQICNDLTYSKKHDGCFDIEDAVEDAIDKCDDDNNDVTDDFCSTLTA